MTLSAETLERIQAESQARVDDVCDLTVRICAVKSPTGAEGVRAEFVASLFRERGYEPEIDEVSNVYVRRGTGSGPVLLVDAHLDTVFPASTEIKPYRDGEYLYGPGIGDNSLSVASMITLFDVLDDMGIETPIDLVAVGTVGEEGLGNLRGARAAVERYQQSGELAGHLVVDGKIGGITHVAVGSNRWKVTVNGAGGHSFGAFGIPSAIHGLGRIIAAIAELEVPADPKTTYNVGLIEGGTSVNTIAASATAIIDMRSTSADELAKLSAKVKEIIETRPGPELTAEIEVVGERPAGMTPKDAPLVKLAAETLAWLGYDPEYRSSSTNMNIPVSVGVPAVCIGISDGQRTHTVHEHVPITPIPTGLAQLIRLTLESAEELAT